MGRRISQARAVLVIASVCVAAAVTGGFFFAPDPPHLPQYPSPNPQERDYRAGGAECEPAIVHNLPVNRNGANQRGYCADKAEEHRQAEADLVQQTRAADAAQEGAKLAFYQAEVMLWGTVLGFCTLVAAVAAAWYAREAAKASGQALKDAHSAERPYVYFYRTNKVRDRARRVKAICGVTFINAGRTAAHVTHLTVRHKLSDAPPDPRGLALERYPPSSAIFADQEWPLKGEVPLRIDGCELRRADGLRHFAYGRMVYKDAFGQAYELWFCRVYNGQGSFTFDPDTPEMERLAFNGTRALSDAQFSDIERAAVARTA